MENKNLPGVISISEHKLGIRRTRKNCAVFFLIIIGLLFLDGMRLRLKIQDYQFREQEFEQSKRELRHYQLKEKLLYVLREKPLTLSQGLDVSNVILLEERVPTTMILGILEQESKFKVDAVSYKGASGIAQVMPATFKMFAPNPLIKNYMDPAESTRTALNYLAILHKEHRGWNTALRVYQAGPDNAGNKAFDWYPKAVLTRVARYDRYFLEQ